MFEKPPRWLNFKTPVTNCKIPYSLLTFSITVFNPSLVKDILLKAQIKFDLTGNRFHIKIENPQDYHFDLIKHIISSHSSYLSPSPSYSYFCD